jgi:hypothetical protein
MISPLSASGRRAPRGDPGVIQVGGAEVRSRRPPDVIQVPPAEGCKHREMAQRRAFSGGQQSRGAIEAIGGALPQRL